MTKLIEENSEIICLKNKSSFSPPELDEIIGIADNVFTNTNPINGLRHNPENGTCGW